MIHLLASAFVYLLLFYITSTSPFCLCPDPPLFLGGGGGDIRRAAWPHCSPHLKAHWQHDDKTTSVSELCSLSFLITLVKVEEQPRGFWELSHRERPGGSSIRHIRPPHWEECDFLWKLRNSLHSPAGRVWLLGTWQQTDNSSYFIDFNQIEEERKKRGIKVWK